MLRMDQMRVIRHKVLREGVSIRRVARELSLSRNTVSKYLQQSAPVRRSHRRRARPGVTMSLGETYEKWKALNASSPRVEQAGRV